ncbi:glycoside hydrolase family 3 C-terminal domain-containing protein [uncultured Vibrio sp.]|uniref:glycoside hydrolase family 3 C-terminal domain-containing protein n=1 Tax=uncultured Vibrio sp. TaxID=114054 RepID=UPI002AA72EAB|nr:glycoside hydrolase family 3 C-terminal domain-containing protein [uncultured Vibrio sp.]
MLKTKLSVVSVMVATALLAGCNDSDTDTITDNERLEAQAQEIVSKMTSDEKLKMVIGPGFFSSPVNLDPDKAVAGTVGYINGVKNEETGLDVPAIKLMDGPAGIRISATVDGDPNTYYATNFPSATVLASTWNADLVQRVGDAAGEEGKEYGVDIWLAPGMNIQRHPLAGRNFEYFSEDPLISGVMGAAIVNGAQEHGIGTTIKHYVANNSETLRRTSNTVITPRAMREIYLRGFKYTIQHAQPWAIMSSYNSVNGENVGERTDLMNTIARDEWGFEGLAMSDWWAGWDPVEMLKAGTDVIEPGGVWRFGGSDDWSPYLVDAYERGELTDEVLDKNIVRILKQSLKTPSALGTPFTRTPDLAAHAEVALQAAEEGIIMLKNNAALPLATTSNIATFGIGQYATLPVGGGSGSVNSEHIVSFNEGLSEKYTLNSDLEDLYMNVYNSTSLEGSMEVHDEDFNADKYCEGGAQAGETNPAGTFAVCRELNIDTASITAAADSSDVAVITITRTTAEGTDNPERTEELTHPMNEGYYLNAVERSLITRVSDAFHAVDKKVVVILNVGNSIDTAEWRDEVDGILVTYLPGQTAGTAVANIISGEVNPSGKLAQTFPMGLDTVSSYSEDGGSFPGKFEDGQKVNAGPHDAPELNYDTCFVLADADCDERDFNQYYSDDIYVGYRYHSTFDVDVAYPFGFGLSYTTFDFANAAVVSNTFNSEGAEGSVSITATVRNTGGYAGKEVAQVYVSAPDVKLAKPEIELKAFDKTDEIAVGGEQTLTFDISAETLASFNEASDQWIIEPGTYTAYVGNSSSLDGSQTVTFSIDNEIVVSATTPGTIALQPEYGPVLEQRLLRKQ